MNTATISGRLTRDPELRTTVNGVEYAYFTAAVRRAYKSAGGEDQTDFINCKAWRQKARFLADYAHKGDTIGVTGSIQQERFTDRSGIEREWVGINATEVEIISKKQDAQSGGQQTRYREAPEPRTLSNSAVLDELPMGDVMMDTAELPF